MELFIPSLTFLLVAVAIAYFVFPALAPPLLIGGSAFVLIGAVYLHYSRFGVMEYERATWQYNLRKYSNWVIMGAILLGAYGFYAMNNQSESSGSQNMLPSAVANVLPSASPALPALEAPAMIGGGMATVFKTASSRLGELMRRGRISV